MDLVEAEYKTHDNTIDRLYLGKIFHFSDFLK